jgi:hypothetical protein
MPSAAYVKYTNAISPMLNGDNASTAAWKVALAATVTIANRH